MSRTLNNSKTDYNLETQLKNANATDFPSIPTGMQNNTKSYPDKYDLLKTKLGSKHDLVEVMSTLCSLEHEIQNISINNTILKGRDTLFLKGIFVRGLIPFLSFLKGCGLNPLTRINDELYDKIILLNKHGKEHVESVISRASDLAKCIIDKEHKFSPFEIFILLCAIQIHDIGNMYGRDNHTTSFESDFERYAKESFINDAVLIKCIFNTAKVHGGKIRGNSDTIEAAGIRYKTTVLQIDIRQRLLAAILRFADELADDNTRALDIDISKIPEYSKIYHAYSNSLHTVRIEKEDKEDAYFVKLCYFMSIQQAFCSYKKLKRESNGNIISISLPLIREIIERTKKMERERRYCSRHFLPYIILKHIMVEIEIDLGGFEGLKRIVYTLEETGYPNEDIELPPTIEDNIASLESEYATAGGVR